MTTVMEIQSALDNAADAAMCLLDATEKLDDLLRARVAAVAIGLPTRQVAFDDIDAEITFIRRKVDKVAAYSKMERVANGW